LLIAFGFATLVSCSDGACIPEYNPPDPELLPEKHKVEIGAPDGSSYTYLIQCEKYYDAICSTRENFWAVRETGLGGYMSVRRIKVTEAKLGEIEIGLPQCVNLVKDEMLPLNWHSVYVRGERSSPNQIGVTMKVNGVQLK